MLCVRTNAVALGLSALLLAGCAAGPKPSTAAAAKPVESPVARRYCDALHALPAQRRQECCPRTAATSVADLCTAEVSAALARGAVTLDASAVDRCAAAMAKRLEGCDWVTPVAPPLPAECKGLFQGGLAKGTPCASALECKDGLFCRGASAGRNGVCAPPAAVRAPCSTPFDNLSTFAGGRGDPRHSECEGRCFKGQCYPVAGPGGECISSAFCASGLTCSSGRCTENPPAKLGDACAKVSGCELGAFCNDDGRCVPLKGAGEPCTGVWECRGLRCDRTPGAPTGYCGDPCGGLPTPAAGTD
jgi:hypothetical protein